LYLGKNQLSLISRGTFKGLKNLQILRLIENSITSIEHDSFSELKALVSLEVDANLSFANYFIIININKMN
jgi:Leucine-rich repeat (LRR) protein